MNAKKLYSFVLLCKNPALVEDEIPTGNNILAIYITIKPVITNTTLLHHMCMCSFHIRVNIHIPYKYLWFMTCIFLEPNHNVYIF